MIQMKTALVSANWVRLLVIFLTALGISNLSFADQNIVVHDHIPAGTLTKSALVGKAIKFTYVQAVSVTPYGEGEYEAISFGETVDIFFRQGTCTWTGLEGKFVGETAVQSCGQKEIAPNIYFVTWLEKSGQVVSMVINVEAKTVNSSFLSEGPRGLDNLEFLQATIIDFGGHDKISALRNNK